MRNDFTASKRKGSSFKYSHTAVDLSAEQRDQSWALLHCWVLEELPLKCRMNPLAVREESQEQSSSVNIIHRTLLPADMGRSTLMHTHMHTIQVSASQYQRDWEIWNCGVIITSIKSYVSEIIITAISVKEPHKHLFVLLAQGVQLGLMPLMRKSQCWANWKCLCWRPELPGICTRWAFRPT